MKFLEDLYYSTDYMYSHVQKASLSLMKEQFSRLAQSASSNIFLSSISSSRHIWLHEWKTDPGLETERLDIASIVVGSDK